MSTPVRMFPSSKKINEVAWLFNTRKYISKFDVREAYTIFFGSSDHSTPTTECLSEIFTCQENKNEKITAMIVSHDFDRSCVEKYIDVESLRDFGISLAIEFRMLSHIIDKSDVEDIFLYLTEYCLNDNELLMVSNADFLNKLSHRIVDANKVMYTTLLDNFYKLLQINDYGVVDEKFVSGYIAHSSFYNGNQVLKYLLESFTASHPLFEELDCLSWYPFTKSRRYSHWLKVESRMNELSKYYLDISENSCNINKNKVYLEKYIQYMEAYREAR